MSGKSLLLTIVLFTSSFVTSSASAYMLDDDPLTQYRRFDSGIIFGDGDESNRYHPSTIPDWRAAYTWSEEISGWNFGQGRQAIPNFSAGLLSSAGTSEGRLDWSRSGLNDGIEKDKLTQIACSFLGGSATKHFPGFWHHGKCRRHNNHGQVPIPGTAYLLGPGLIGLVLIRRKAKE